MGELKNPPDYIFDPDNWETTTTWDDRSYLIEDLTGELWEPKEFATLHKGPAVYAVEVVLTVDEDGDPDDTELCWFDSLDEARKATFVKVEAEKDK